MAATTFEIPEILTEQEIEKKAAEKKAAKEEERLKEEAAAKAEEAKAEEAAKKRAEKEKRAQEDREANAREDAPAVAQWFEDVMNEKAEKEAVSPQQTLPSQDITEKNDFPIGKFALGSGAALLGWVGYAVDRAKQAQEAAKNILEANMDVLGQGGAGLADKIQNLTPKDAEQWLGYTGVPTAGMDEQQIMSTATEKMREVAQQAEQAHDQVLQALHDGGINVSPEEYYAHLREHTNPQEMIESLSDLQPDMLRGAMEHIGNVVETLDKSGVFQALAFVSTAHAAMQLAGSAREALETNDSSKFFNWDNASNLLRVAAATPTLVLAVHAAQAATQAAIHFSKDSTLKEAQDARDNNAAFIAEITKQMEEGNKSWENRYRATTAQLNGFKIAATCKAAETMNGFRNFFEKAFLNKDETPQPTVEAEEEVEVVEAQIVDAETVDPTVASQRDESGEPTIEIPDEMIKAIETIDPEGDFGFKDGMDMVKQRMSEDNPMGAELYLVTVSLALDDLRASGKLTPEQTEALDNFNTFLHNTVAAQVYGVDGVAKFEEGKLYECVARLDAELGNNNDTIFNVVDALQEGNFDFHDPSAVQDLGEVMHKIRYGGSFFTTEAKQVVEYVQQAFADANQAEALDSAMDRAIYADLAQQAMFQTQNY